jgi:hypothetical protein
LIGQFERDVHFRFVVCLLPRRHYLDEADDVKPEPGLHRLTGFTGTGFAAAAIKSGGMRFVEE